MRFATVASESRVTDESGTKPEPGATGRHPGKRTSPMKINGLMGSARGRDRNAVSFALSGEGK
jgi:hypothetical protein